MKRRHREPHNPQRPDVAGDPALRRRERHAANLPAARRAEARRGFQTRATKMAKHDNSYYPMIRPAMCDCSVLWETVEESSQIRKLTRTRYRAIKYLAMARGLHSQVQGSLRGFFALVRCLLL